MTQPNDELADRVAALEDQYRDLDVRVRDTAREAAAARVLAGGADRDVEQVRDELRDFRRATVSSFNALREDLTDFRTEVNGRFTEINDRFTEVNDRFARVDHRFDQVDRAFIEIRGLLDASAAGQQRITDLLTTLIDQQNPGDSE